MRDTYQWNEDDLKALDLDDNDWVTRGWDAQDLMTEIMKQVVDKDDPEEFQFYLGQKLGIRMAMSLLLPLQKQRATCDLLLRTSYLSSEITDDQWDILDKYREGR